MDTATPAITVALHDGSDVLSRAGGEGAMAHGEQLAPYIQAVLRTAGASMADLTDVAVGVGPGPYTGLRVGVVTALTLGSTLGLATHGVCSLDIIAASVHSAGDFVVATDARRKEVYWARYSGGGDRLAGPDVARPAELAAQQRDVTFYGRGAALYDDLLDGAGRSLDPDAGALAQLVVSRTARELPLEPLYLRRPDAVPSASAKRA